MTWTTDWPTEPGWYWSWREGDTHRDTEAPHIKPTEVRLAGAEPRMFLIYIRDGAFFYKTEQGRAVWWLPLVVPEGPEVAP